MKQFKPTAHIAVGKNRAKQGREVYLDNDTEFEIELYNPTEFVVCAKIWINGIQMEGGALVIKPAQRVFLDRYLNEPKKLKFSTYNVSGSKEEIENAIKKNGLVEVKFYNEIKPVNNTLILGNQSTPCNPWQPDWYQPFTYYSDRTVPINDNFGGHTYTTSVAGSMDNSLSFFSQDLKDINIERRISDGNPPPDFGKNKFAKKSKKQETGRIEAGSKSDQTFEYVNMSFAFSPCAEYTYHILPASQKKVEAQEIGGKVYCTGCKLRKRKENWKFCPKCGTEFEF